MDRLIVGRCRSSAGPSRQEYADRACCNVRWHTSSERARLNQSDIGEGGEGEYEHHFAVCFTCRKLRARASLFCSSTTHANRHVC